MNTKSIILSSISTLVFLVGATELLAQPNSNRPSVVSGSKPNIILMMADDLGWGDTGYNGHPFLNTPNLDKMSAEGVTFNRFYSAAAMCSPTRGSVYTGRNPYRFGITYAMKGRLEDTEIPVTSVVKEAGYTTGHFGKWHLGTLSRIKGDQSRWGSFEEDPVRYYCPPWERDVDVSFVTESKVPTWDPLLHPDPIKGDEVSDATFVGARGSSYGNDYFTGEGQTETENMDGDDSRVIMDRAIPFIQNAVKEETPFFTVIWFHTPHSPVVGGDEYRAMYKDHPEPAQHYYACVTAMDEQIGRLRSELSNLGVADNTMLWFCSDNGPARQGSPRHVGSPGHLSGYKLSIQEGGIRVPGLLVWPDQIKQPITISEPCVTSDYFPTILSSLGIDLPNDRPYDGINLWPLIQGQSKERTKPIGFLNKEATEAVWMGTRYKLLSTPEGDQLFDIVNDPAEKGDLSVDLPSITQTMKFELNQWKAGVLADLNSIP
ncbi:MAG: sulfatase-like hydrolase/transferase [Opitutaceae bacterium]|nr:sulfatase-like hydrolase/transferase [Opitutaceae bacterium]